MSDIITKEATVQSCRDFELDIDRRSKVSYKYTYKSSGTLQGIVFIVPGFGEDTNSEYSDNLREYIANKFSLLAVSVVYHCFHSRVNNGASILIEETDMKVFEKYCEEHSINYASDISINDSLLRLNDSIQDKKDGGLISKDYIASIHATLSPNNDEYQNFGILQALDHINVLMDLEKKDLNFVKNYSVTMMGSSHGGYISYMAAKLAPHKIDYVIENSSYTKPLFRYLVGKEYDKNDSEMAYYFGDNVRMDCFVKTNWTLDENSKYFFSKDRYSIRYISDENHLQKMKSYSNSSTKYISYHSAEDRLATIEDKKKLYKLLNKLGFHAQLHVIEKQSQVDGKFIKTLNHGMDMSLKELANRELPNIIDNTLIKDNQNLTVTYSCSSTEYQFQLIKGTYVGNTKPIQTEDDSSTTDVNTIAVQTYQRNIDYLKSHQISVYEKLAALDSAIEQGYYKERYELVYENDNFDVFEIETEKYLYNKNSKEHAFLASKSIDYQLNDNQFEGFQKKYISDHDLQMYKDKKSFTHHMSGFAPIVKYCQDNLHTKSTLAHIKKFIFFGTGLGLHINSIHQKILSEVYFIIEDDLELFRLSLFTIDYKEMATKSKLIFSIFEDNDGFLKSSEKFLKEKYYYNHHLKYFHILSHKEDKRNQFHISITSQSHFLFFYNHLLTQYCKPLNYLFDNYNFLDKTINFNTPELSKTPFLLIAAGPSLEKNIAWLKENQDKFIIVALSATLSYLEENLIRPDIITHLDAFEAASIHFNKIKSMDFFKDSVCFFSDRSSTYVISKFNKRQIYLFENGTQYKESSLKPSAPCVGSLTYQLLLLLRPANVYLLGLDLAIDSSTGQTHSSSHEYTQKLDTKENAFEDQTMTYKSSLFKVEGNFEQTVLTTPHFKTSIDTINMSTQLLKDNSQNIFNLSHGAKFIGINAKEIKTIETKMYNRKSDIINCLTQICKTNSSTEFNNLDLKKLEDKLSHAKRTMQYLSNHKKLYYSSTEEYLTNIQELVAKLTNNEAIRQYEISRVLDTYFKYILGYIFDFFNHEETQQDFIIHIEALNKSLIDHALKIVEYFHDSLSSKLSINKEI